MTIKIKSLLMGAVAASAMVGGMAFAPSSAQALTLENGQTLGLDGGVRVSRNEFNQFSFSFPNARINTTGTSAPFSTGDTVNISGLSNLTIGAVAGPASAFITGILLDDGTEVGFNADRVTLVDDKGGKGALRLNGNFFGANANNKLGFGSLTFSFPSRNSNATLFDVIRANQTRNTTFQSQIEVVPTPAAVLPALFGMGAAAFRKKKRESENELVPVGAEEA